MCNLTKIWNKDIDNFDKKRVIINFLSYKCYSLCKLEFMDIVIAYYTSLIYWIFIYIY